MLVLPKVASTKVTGHQGVYLCSIVVALLHHRLRPCFMTDIPLRSRAKKHLTIKSDAFVQPVAGLKYGKYIGSMA